MNKAASVISEDRRSDVTARNTETQTRHKGKEYVIGGSRRRLSSLGLSTSSTGTGFDDLDVQVEIAG